MDKIRFTEHAQAHGLAIPETRILRDRRDAEAAQPPSSTTRPSSSPA